MVTSAYALSANTTMTVRMKIRHIDRPAVTDTGGARKELSIPHHPVSPGRGMLLRLPTLDVRTAHRGSALRSHHSHQRQQPAIPEGMYKRAIKPIREFLSSPPPRRSVHHRLSVWQNQLRQWRYLACHHIKDQR